MDLPGSSVNITNVIEGLKQGFLLGRNFTSRHDAILNYKDGHITFGYGNITIPFIPMKTIISARLARTHNFYGSLKVCYRNLGRTYCYKKL